jgi:hypothetical protein
MQVLDTPTTSSISFSPLVRQYTLEEFWTLPEPEDRAHYEQYVKGDIAESRVLNGWRVSVDELFAGLV